MADSAYTKERAAWVLARAGRNPAARRRGERLAVRARRDFRDEAGAGDAPGAEVVTPNRWHRGIYREEGTGNKLGWTLTTALREAAVLVVAGPATGLSWGLYGLWYRQRESWGPLRPLPAAIAAAVAAVLAAIVGWAASPGLLGWWLMANLVGGLARLVWLTRAYGWPAAEAAWKRTQTRTRRAPTVVQVPKEAPRRVVRVVRVKNTETKEN